MRDSNTARLRRVVEIRDASLALTRSKGRWSGSFVADGLTWMIRVGSIGALRVALRIPFTPPPELSDQLRYMVAGVPRVQLVEHPFGLDVWAGKKVLNLKWSDNDEFNVVSFRRGTWEDELLKAAESLKRQVAE